MKPGEIIVLNEQLGIYGKISYKSLVRVKNNLAVGVKLNRKLASLWNWSIGRKIKAGNKFLKRQGLDEIQMLTVYDIERIKTTKGKEPPLGSLLCKLK